MNLHREPGSAVPAASPLRAMLQWIPESVKEPFRTVLGKAHPYGLSASLKKHLKELPRYQQASVTLFEHELVIVDAASFLASHQEIFEHQIYNFSPATSAPVIIDAGANIGLASIYFHRANPASRITAIESDPAIYAVLCRNLKSFGATNVEVIHGAAWDRHEDLRFSQDHADAGRISDHGETLVRGIRLRDLIEGQHIDLLKMDIEGAETRVLMDCEGAMGGVQRMFVEYHSFAGEPQSLAKLLSVLKRSGFHYYIQHTGVHSPHPLVKLEQQAGFDLQLNIFAVRRELL